ncbi:MAG: NTP transferase domain-containing protein [Lachnospiraceae bacterium]|nr:NTP transferase domain-containing protein [Lachnospiraceae bacterium]
MKTTKTTTERLTKQESDILYSIFRKPFVNQRILSQDSGHSLGIVNKCLSRLTADGYLDEHVALTKKAEGLLSECVPENAIILAAGFGMRMVPINLSTPKALIEVYGEPLIERIIRQLHDVGIKNITVVVGFMKESFEYLMDEFGVSLIVNPDYAKKNNLSSLALAADRISNTYIIPSDIWCDRNPFNDHELYSWYMVSDLVDNDSDVRVNRKMELVRTGKNSGGNAMVGITYLTKADAGNIVPRIRSFSADNSHDDDFWEAVLYSTEKMMIPARVVHSSDVVEIDTYEQLRDLDDGSNHLRSDALDIIADVFDTTPDNVVDISVLKKGMTNRSFLFSVNDERYIMRIPGEGTDQLINRVEEAEVFRTISGLGLCDDPVYINPKNGYKITKFLEGIRCCDPESIPDLERSMEKLKSFHNMHLSVKHTFDIFGNIDYYESLWHGKPSMYKDYIQTRNNVLSLKPFIDGLDKEWCLTHIDAVPDNFLFYQTDQGEEVQLTDWEYAGMQDPHVDIAMFSVYSLYSKEEIDRLIDIYFENKCDRATRAKIYAYVAMCGLLWSNWCEFKSQLGVEFGEYSLRQYRYAKDYYNYCLEYKREL